MRLRLTIKVDKVLYSALATADSNATTSTSSTAPPETLTTAPTTGVSSSAAGTATLHVSGPVTSEETQVSRGSYHTLDLEVGRDFTIIKAEGEWDSIARERIREITEPGRGAEVGAIVCGEGQSRSQGGVSGAEALLPLSLWLGADPTRVNAGLANICLITNHTTIIRQRIDVPIPRKRKGGSTALGADKVRCANGSRLPARNA